MTFMVMQIPLVGGTIYTAMEFHGMGKIIKSDHIDTDDKVEEVVKTVTKVTMSLGTAVGGGIVGQILIPIPVFGAFIGGVVGGALGTVFGKALDKLTAHKPIKYSVVVDKMTVLRQEDGGWKFDNFTGQLKTIMARWHAISLPDNIDQDLWLSVICFMAISVYVTVLAGNIKKVKNDGEHNHEEGEMEEKKNQSQLDYEENERKLLKRNVDEINRYLELSISFFAERLDLLAYQDSLGKINLALGGLIKEKMIEFDLEK